MGETVMTNNVARWVKQHSWLLVIFLLALFLRTFRLETLPSTFFVDEVLSGYLGRYLLTNGIDLYGNRWPLLYFNKFNDYYIILPMYLDGLSTMIFGVTRFATRFPTALFGALLVFPTYALTHTVFSKQRGALLAAMLVAVLPWHIVLSRSTTESVLELSIVATSLWSFLLYKRTKSWRWLILSVALSFLSYFVYHTARVYVPLVWLGTTVCFWHEFSKKHIQRIVLGIVTFCFFALTLGISQTEWGSGRFDQTSIFSKHSGVAIRMTEMTYNLGHDSALTARIFHNKVIGFGREYVNQYLSYFSPLYLFTDDAWLKTRYAVPEAGPLPLTILAMLLSLLWPVKDALVNKRDRSIFMWLGWMLLIAPVPAALTVVESPNIRRSLLMALPIVILAAGAWERSFSIRWKQISLGVIFGVLLALETVLFLYFYSYQSDLYSSLHRSDGQFEVAQYVAQQDSDMPIIITDTVDFPLYLLFVKEDFSTHYADQFGFELRIPKIDQANLFTQKCALELSPEMLAEFPSDVKIIEPGFCKLESCRFTEIEKIQAQHPLNYSRVVTSIPAENINPNCVEL